MKTRITTLIWFLAAGMWGISGLLFLLWLHRWFFGAVFLASAALALFIAARYRSKEAKGQTSVPPHSSGEIDHGLNG
jgi:membrane protein implicated in regulation of membrane protease activity